MCLKYPIVLNFDEKFYQSQSLLFGQLSYHLKNIYGCHDDIIATAPYAMALIGQIQKCLIKINVYVNQASNKFGQRYHCTCVIYSVIYHTRVRFDNAQWQWTNYIWENYLESMFLFRESPLLCHGTLLMKPERVFILIAWKIWQSWDCMFEMSWSFELW